MANKKAVKQPVVIKPNVSTPCPKGQTRNSQGVCIDDPA